MPGTDARLAVEYLLGLEKAFGKAFAYSGGLAGSLDARKSWICCSWRLPWSTSRRMAGSNSSIAAWMRRCCWRSSSYWRTRASDWIDVSPKEASSEDLEASTYRHHLGNARGLQIKSQRVVAQGIRREKQASSSKPKVSAEQLLFHVGELVRRSCSAAIRTLVAAFIVQMLTRYSRLGLLLALLDCAIAIFPLRLQTQ